MLGLTRRQSLVAAVALGVGAAIVAAAAVGRTGLAVALTGLLLVAAVGVLLDVRRRQGAMATTVEKIAEEQRRLRSTVAGVDAMAAKLTTIGSTSESIRATLAGVSSSLVDLANREDELTRKVETAVALERIAAAERYRELLDSVAEVRERVRRLEYEPVRQVQALMELLPTIEPRAPLPPVGHWSLEPAGLLALTYLVSQRTPELIVECGSGTSSVWLGYAVQAEGRGRVVSLEHDEEYAQRTRAQLRQHGLTEHVEVRTAPLTSIEADGADYQWYEPSAVADLTNIGILLVDGPPQATGPMARYPALHMLGDKLAADAVIVVDDAIRPDESAMIERWRTEMPELAVLPTGSSRVVVLDRAHA